MSEAPHYDLSIPGWMDEPELEWLYQTASRMTSVAEIGSFQGRSTVALMRGCRRVYSIDPWDADWLKQTFGETGAVEGFVRNVLKATGRLPVMYPMPSHEAQLLLADIDMDMVFIDADHSEACVARDIEIWQLQTCRVLCGHDYGDPNWPGVQLAVDAALSPSGILGQFKWKLTRPVGSIWAVSFET